MPAIETNVGLASETTLSSSLSAGATTLNVVSTSSFPATPFYVVVDPDVDAKREVILVDGSTTSTTMVLSGVSSRAKDGTSDVSHDSGAIVAMVPVPALWTDINDRVDGVKTTADAAYAPGGTDVTVADGGTGASSASTARTNLGLGTAAVEDLSALPATTMAGELNFADNLLIRPTIKDYAEEVATDATSGAAKTLDLTAGNVHDITLTANCTFTFSNPPATGDAGSFTLILRQDGTGSRTATWPASVGWPEGTAPTLTTTASGVDVLTFLTVDAGTTWLGFVSGQAFS